MGIRINIVSVTWTLEMFNTVLNSLSAVGHYRITVVYYSKLNLLTFKNYIIFIILSVTLFQ